jgi:hypothetical protein
LLADGKELSMRAVSLMLRVCAVALALAPGYGAAQIIVGAGHRTDGTPSDRLARNIPEPVSREADDPRAADRLMYPRPRPGAGVEVGPVSPAAQPAARSAAPDTGYSADPVPKDDPAPRGPQERPAEGYDYN